MEVVRGNNLPDGGSRCASCGLCSWARITHVMAVVHYQAAEWMQVQRQLHAATTDSSAQADVVDQSTADEVVKNQSLDAPDDANVAQQQQQRQHPAKGSAVENPSAQESTGMQEGISTQQPHQQQPLQRSQKLWARDAGGSEWQTKQKKRCKWGNKCRWGNSCNFAHVDSGKKWKEAEARRQVSAERYHRLGQMVGVFQQLVNVTTADTCESWKSFARRDQAACSIQAALRVWRLRKESSNGVAATHNEGVVAKPRKKKKKQEWPQHGADGDDRLLAEAIAKADAERAEHSPKEDAAEDGAALVEETAGSSSSSSRSIQRRSRMGPPLTMAAPLVTSKEERQQSSEAQASRAAAAACSSKHEAEGKSEYKALVEQANLDWIAWMQLHPGCTQEEWEAAEAELLVKLAAANRAQLHPGQDPI